MTLTGDKSEFIPEPRKNKIIKSFSSSFIEDARNDLTIYFQSSDNEGVFQHIVGKMNSNAIYNDAVLRWAEKRTLEGKSVFHCKRLHRSKFNPSIFESLKNVFS